MLSSGPITSAPISALSGPALNSQTCAATTAPITGLSRAGNRTVAATTAPIAGLGRAGTRTIAASASMAAALARLVGKASQASAGQAVALARATIALRQATTAPASSAGRSVALLRSAVVAQAASLVRRTALSRRMAQTGPVASLSRSVSRLISARAATAASLLWATAKRLQTSARFVVRGSPPVSLALQASAGLVGSTIRAKPFSFSGFIGTLASAFTLRRAPPAATNVIVVPPDIRALTVLPDVRVLHVPVEECSMLADPFSPMAPGDADSFSLDFTDWLAAGPAGDTIASAIVAVFPGGVIPSNPPLITGGKVSLWLNGGIAETVYLIGFTASTTKGRRATRTARLPCET